jgi:hypothetical protein
MFSIKPNIKKLISLMLLLALQVQSNTISSTSKQTFDDHRPKDISNNKWSALKTVVQEAKILPKPVGGEEGGLFGVSVSLEGNRALIGAPNIIEHGVVFVFEFDGGNWIKTATLRPLDGRKDDLFGFSVSLSGNRALIGAFRDDNDNGIDSGSAYIFDLNADVWTQTSKLTAGDGAPSDWFGFSVSLLGDRVLIGANYDDDHGTNSGSAYIFDLINGLWSQTAKLRPPFGTLGANFGISVSLSDDRALVGAYLFLNDNGRYTGSAYIFNLNADVWSRTSELFAENGLDFDFFGFSVSLSGDRALVGAYGDGNSFRSSGFAYVFELSSGHWLQTARLTADDAMKGNRFGNSVSLSGERALIGARLDDSSGANSGSAYVFDLNAGIWSQTSKLTANDGVEADQFGRSVSLSGGRVLVGAVLDDDTGIDSGSAYIFDTNLGLWSQTVKLNAGDGAPGDNFGSAVSISGNRALVGAPAESSTDPGSAYIFDYFAGNWSHTAKFTADDGAASDRFGVSVSLSGGRALVGAKLDDDNGDSSGSAYIFDLNVMDNTWSQTSKLTAEDGAAFDLFGSSVSLSGNRALVGSYADDDNGNASGSAYIFDLDTMNNTWSQTSKLTAFDGLAFDWFGFSVSLSGDRALVGVSANQTATPGSAYIFELDSGDWLQTAKLTADDGGTGDEFGYSVDITEGRVLVGARLGDNNGSSSGSAYIFDLDAGLWSQTAKLIADDGSVGEEFGYSVSLSGNRAIVGARLDDDNGAFSGSAYIFDLNLNNNTWSQSIKLTADDGEAFDMFGYSVSLSGDKFLVGAYAEDENGNDAGAAYIFINPDVFVDSFENLK